MTPDSITACGDVANLGAGLACRGVAGLAGEGETRQPGEQHCGVATVHQSRSFLQPVPVAAPSATRALQWPHLHVLHIEFVTGVDQNVIFADVMDAQFRRNLDEPERVSLRIEDRPERGWP